MSERPTLRHAIGTVVALATMGLRAQNPAKAQHDRIADAVIEYLETKGVVLAWDEPACREGPACQHPFADIFSGETGNG